MENTCKKLTVKYLTRLQLVPGNRVHENCTLTVLDGKTLLFHSFIDQSCLSIYMKYSLGTSS